MRPNVLKSFGIFEIYNVRQHLGMPKNSYFSQYFTDCFKQIIEVGILAKFQRYYEFLYALEYFVEEKRTFVLTLQHIEPCLLLLVIGHVMSLVTFMLEMLVYKFKPWIIKTK